MQHLNWLEEIDQNTHFVKELFLDLNEDQLNAKPNQNTWSIAQNLAHLIVINESYYPILQDLHHQTYKAPFHAKFPFLVSFFGKFVLKSVTPDRRKKMKTFPIWEPGQSAVVAGILDRFIQHQEELKNAIENAAVFTGNNVVIGAGSIINKDIPDNVVADEVMVISELPSNATPLIFFGAVNLVAVAALPDIFPFIV
ncbi:MAG: hypothetical protein RL751_1982, partial [Bacteroidota bacterium]